MPKRTFTAALLLALCVTGCGSQKQQDLKPDVLLPDNAAEATVPEDASPSRSIAERAKSMQEAGETHLFDEQGVLTEEEAAQYNQYLGWVSDIRQIRSAAVITDALDGQTPEGFAQSYYRALFGEGTSGFLVLVNNDSGKDYIYCEGVCTVYLADTSMQIAKATPLLVEGRYAEALEILLPVGELVPDRVLDRADVLTYEQAQALTERANPSERRCCVIFTDALPALGSVSAETTAPDDAASAETAEQTAEPSETSSAQETEPVEGSSDDTADLAAFAEDLRVKNEAEVLLVIDTVNRRAWIAGGDYRTLSDEVQSILREQNAFDAAQHYYDAVLGE